MKKQLLCYFLAGSMVLSLCGCGMFQNYGSGSPWIDSDLEANLKKSSDVSLKDDFALAVNADWSLANPPKEGQKDVVYLSSFEDELNSRLIGIATDDSYGNDHDAELVYKYYNAYLDWDARDAAGVEPLMPYLEEITNINSLEDFYTFSTAASITFADAYAWGIGISPDDSSQKIINISAPEVFLMDNAEYQNLDKLDDYTKVVCDCEKKIVSKVLTRCGYSEDEAEAIFDGAIEFEKIWTQYCYTNDDWYLTETNDIINHQLYSYEEISNMDGMDVFLQSIENYGITEVPQFQIYEKMDYIEHLNDIYCEDNLELIKDYLLAHTAVNVVDSLDKELFYFSLDMTNEISGSTGYEKEEKYAIDSATSALGWPMSKLYCEKYVTPQDKENVYNVISDIIDEYKNMISEEEFLSEETKTNAIRKLDGMLIKCMYPDTWYDYSNLELNGSFLDMTCAVIDFEQNRTFSEFNDPVDREDWNCTPITINAFYSPQDNSINILPGLIGDVLYNEDMEKEEVYAMLGAVIGHEISHGFDPNGATYDENGNYCDWWTEEDYELFGNLTNRLVDYYDNIVVWKGVNCNGELVKDEACADMAGVACILRIAAKDPNFDYDLFFRSYAKIWATNRSENDEYFRVMYDAHPLSYLRVNAVVAQFDEFYATYDIKEGDGMYIAPEDRVAIW